MGAINSLHAVTFSTRRRACHICVISVISSARHSVRFSRWSVSKRRGFKGG